jgi:hypothetical protein
MAMKHGKGSGAVVDVAEEYERIIEQLNRVIQVQSRAIEALAVVCGVVGQKEEDGEGGSEVETHPDLKE